MQYNGYEVIASISVPLANPKVRDLIIAKTGSEQPAYILIEPFEHEDETLMIGQPADTLDDAWRNALTRVKELSPQTA